MPMLTWFTPAILRRIESKLDAVLARFTQMETKMSQEMQAAIDDLISTVEPLTDAVASNVALMDRLADLLTEHADDPMQVRTVADQLRAAKQQLAEAVMRNTPAEAPPAEPATPA
jgi:hypothetical protein